MSSDEALERWHTGMGNDAEQPARSASAGQPQAAKAGVPIGLAAAASALELRKKTVLLVDSNLRSREARAKVMRAKGVHVDCVTSADAARARLAIEKFNLILVDLGHETEVAEALVREIRSKNSRQLVGFLVGSPLFVAKSLSGSTPRPNRAPTPAMVAAAESPSGPAMADSDFGQRIRDAEADLS